MGKLRAAPKILIDAVNGRLGRLNEALANREAELYRTNTRTVSGGVDAEDLSE